MRIAFLANNCIPFHGKTLEERPLGGTETAVIRIAEAVQALGHEVVVLTQIDNPPVTEVLYLPLKSLHHLGEVDVAIMARDWNLGFLPVKAKKKFFWTGDSYDQFATYGIGDTRIVNAFDGLFTVSDWHSETLCKASGFPLAKTRPLRNGVHLPYFEGSETRNAKRLIYSSSPYRGLLFLISTFPAIKAKHPEAELHIFSGYDVYAGAPGTPRNLLQEFEAMKTAFGKIDGCVMRGNIPQAELAQEMLQASILAYPNIFEETSCITAMEAKAGGCVIVTSDKGALKETVGSGGVLIGGDPRNSKYREYFVDAINNLLDDEERMALLSVRNRAEAFSSLGWNHRAAELTSYLSTLL